MYNSKNSMRKFFRDISLFIILVFLIAICCDYVISTGLRKTTIREFAVWNDIYNKHNLDNDMVFIGASSCWAHYNPAIFDSTLNIRTYNLGIDGHSWYPCQPLRYNTYIKHSQSKPKYVIINIDMATLGSNTNFKYEREQFFPYFHVDDSLVNAVKDTKDFSILDIYLPLWRYIGYRKIIENGTLSFFGKTKFEDDGVIKGYRGNTYSWNRSSLNNYDSITIIENQYTLDSLIQFIRSRKKEEQEVILVKSPIYKPLQQKITNKENFNSLCDSIADFTNSILLDYWDINISVDSTYFYNPSHLNAQGSNYFSTRIAHDLDSIFHTRVYDIQ